MKKILLCVLAALALVCACKKNSTTTTTSVTSPFAGCFNHTYIHTYPSGQSDTTNITYVSDDSLSYTIHSAGTNYIYCYKLMGDSISMRRYTNNLSVLSYYGTSHLNSQWFSTSDIFYQQNGSLASTGNSTYNSDGRPLMQISDYQTYLYNGVNHYDANGNKFYTIATYTGTVSSRDSFVYQYDLTKTAKMNYGYPIGKLFGSPDRNLVTKVTRYATPADTIESFSDYTYTLDADGYVIQMNTQNTTTGTGAVSTYNDKFSNRQCR